MNKDIINNLKCRIYYAYFLLRKPLFRYIEIETVNRCNGTCSFCPVNKFQDSRKYAKMSTELFEKIINQLSDLNYKGELALFSNNEPFLDDRIIEFAKLAREKLPHAYIYLYTNGTLLTYKSAMEIEKYLNKIIIDWYYEDKKEVNKEIKKIIKRSEKKLKLREKIDLFYISKNRVGSTRGGQAPNKKIESTVSSLCCLNLLQFVIRSNGKVSLCCNDAMGKYTLGDVNKQSLSDIWYGQKFNIARKRNMKGRQYIKLCKYCDTKEDRILKWKTNK
ncbi:radical SAM/SPASM domain-containing protein [Anaerosacchariphilus polymeriproducens]|uniref:Radical SAM/SPASM domain-containing protein n=1 Tax=Anaerosacchariphilus polymeriproducens TaxID=1812858 RepID=A0A371ATI9_9FIRM|nr:radical SAM/SPASM domain-containing protein [Anaerosacchariphilus polymeriproducens]RDU22800.1 radical SAM/SPASM domain-containing protein [Anaerosacchariphilus polymeriproducens]